MKLETFIGDDDTMTGAVIMAQQEANLFLAKIGPANVISIQAQSAQRSPNELDDGSCWHIITVTYKDDSGIVPIDAEELQTLRAAVAEWQANTNRANHAYTQARADSKTLRADLDAAKAHIAELEQAQSFKPGDVVRHVSGVTEFEVVAISDPIICVRLLSQKHQPHGHEWPLAGVSKLVLVKRGEASHE